MEKPNQSFSKTVGKYRWTICTLLFFATTINYIDRQIIGLVKPVLEKEFNWSELDYSYIVMAFSAAYATGFIFFGRWIDKIGTKLGYTISIIVWSLAAMAHALASSTFSFGVVRALLGLGEAGNFPAAIKTTAEWFPRKERALATGIFNSGANIGAVVAPVVVPWMLGLYGWEQAFIWTGAIGFVWLIFWLIYYEVPSKQKRLSTEEYNYIHSDQDEQLQDNGAKISWFKLLTFRATWAFFFGKLLTDPIWWFFLFWLPSYFSSAFNINFTKPSWQLAVAYTVTTIGSIGGGYLSSYFITKGWTPFRSRKTAMFIFALCVLPIVTAKFATNAWVAVALISLAMASHQAWSANIFTTVSDMFPKKAVSSVVGIGGMAGAVGSVFFPLLVGNLLNHYKALGNITAGYNLLFIICGCAYLVAWTIMHLLAPRKQVISI